MAHREQFFVVRHDDKWKIKHNGIHDGPFDTQTAAVDAAVARAKETWAAGTPAQVLVQGENMQFRTEWSYGLDPNPPAG